MKKIFLSADIEGTCGIIHWDETEKTKADYAPYARQMTREVDAEGERLREMERRGKQYMKQLRDKSVRELAAPMSAAGEELERRIKPEIDSDPRAAYFDQVYNGVYIRMAIILALLGIADKLIEMKAVCDCGRKATMNLRVDENGKAVSEGAQTEIGGNDRYVAMCRKHFSEALEG